ncbi:MAG: selenium metabolism-associated LysR family transcriptional regulator [Chloroflexota bacterium]|nr:selenium metabolism-associated LysR family transcriptional regulator [Chloroflexota bacterium]
MDIRQLKSFCAVVETGGFSLAARSLGLSQPTISFQVSSLEDELGTQLFDRRGRETTTTKSGELLYRYACKILVLSREAEEAIDQLRGLVRGKLVIGASTIPGEYILPDLLRRYRSRYAGIEVEMLMSDTKEIIERVVDDEVDLGAVGATEKNEKLEFVKLATDKLVLIAPADDRCFQTESATLDEIHTMPFVLRESGSGTRASISKKLGERGGKSRNLNVVMTLGSTTAVIRAVECGAGVSIVSERAVEREVTLGLIRKIEIEGIDPNRDFFIVFRKQKVQSPAVRAFLDFLREESSHL